MSGEIEVTAYQTQRLPDLDAGETADTEHIEGTLFLTATDEAGAVIRIENATFHITVQASRVKLTIS
ncbi:MAG TPA: hypothetical protein VK928_03360 [Longimicrobiales bacterium]|nr:hypothetical protein [Longimicrobiales bacterium]